MVKLLSVLIFLKSTDQVRLLKSQYNLQSFGFFERGRMQEIIQFASRTVVERTALGVRQSVTKDSHVMHIYVREDGLSGVLVSDNEYPGRIAHNLLVKVLDDFTEKTSEDQWSPSVENSVNYSLLPNFFTKYQDLHEADEITKIQRDLDETKIVLVDTIDKVLLRGEKLDELVTASRDLSRQSKLFFHGAKNRKVCCTFT